ncbi:MAG TPA: site-2 protease family protein [Verrucomicrobiae bacterium]|jgi:Zn-dependent protease
MKWSIKLGRFAGIDVYLHVTFLLFLGVLGVMFWQEEQSVAAVFQGVGFFLSLFACVVLHEYGHALTARRFGVHTRDITLLPIGGVARLERMPDKPMQEFWVAVAGPAVNVVIAGVIFLVLALKGVLTPLNEIGLTGGSFLQRLMVVNIFLVAFNMLPAFPMDGGRVLRSLLALKLDYARATQIAAALGQFMALLFVIAGFALGHLMLMVIALFIWVGASQETSVAQLKSALGGIPVEQAMLTDFQVLAPGDSLGRAVELILAGSQHDFPVVEGGTVAGILTRGDLMAALAQRGPSAAVGDVMEREFQRVEAGEMLESAFSRLQESRCPMLPVFHHGELVGLLTTENIGELVMIRTALRESRQTRRKPPVVLTPR